MTTFRWLSALKKYAIKLVWECSMLKLYLLLLFYFEVPWSTSFHLASEAIARLSLAMCLISQNLGQQGKQKMIEPFHWRCLLRRCSPHRLPNRSCVFVENNAFLAFLKESSTILILRILSFARNTVLGSKGDRSYQSSNLQYAFHTDFWQISIQC